MDWVGDYLRTNTRTKLNFEIIPILYVFVVCDQISAIFDWIFIFIEYLQLKSGYFLKKKDVFKFFRKTSEK